MEDLNTILGIVIAIPVITLFTVYWLNSKIVMAPVERRFESELQNREHYESNDTTRASRCSMPT